MAPLGMQSLPGSDAYWFPVDSPGQHSVDTVDRLLVMIVAMRWRWQALRAWDRDLKCGDAARRVVPGDEEAHRKKPDSDGLVGRIDVEV